MKPYFVTVDPETISTLVRIASVENVTAGSVAYPEPPLTTITWDISPVSVNTALAVAPAPDEEVNWTVGVAK